MKILIIAFIFFHTTCNSSQSWTEPKGKLSDTTAFILKKDTLPFVAQIPTKRTGNPKFYTQKNKVKIKINEDDTFSYSKQKFNDIVDFFPEFYSDIVYHPDSLYLKNHFKRFINADGEEEDIRFSSELGRDNYYVLYSYFLKMRNGEKKYTDRRKNLIAIYRHINGIFEGLQGGGTYFGHQHRRILGYAEYSIYQYSQSKNDLKKNFDLVKQKELFLNSLKQIIKDKISVEYVRQERKEKELEFYKYLDEMAVLITDSFYLKEARAFQTDYYNY